MDAYGDKKGNDMNHHSVRNGNNMNLSYGWIGKVLHLRPDGLIKNRKVLFSVIPAKAGIQ